MTRVSPVGSARWLATILCAALCVALLLQNRGLKDELGQARRDLELLRLPEPGMRVPRVKVAGLDGGVIDIGAVGTAQVLFFLEPDCPYCQASVPTMEYLYAQLQDSVPGTAFVALSRSSADSLEEFTDEYRVTYPVARSSAGVHAAFRVPGVPVLLIVGHDGIIEYAHYGVFDDPSLADHVVRSVRRLVKPT